MVGYSLRSLRYNFSDQVTNKIVCRAVLFNETEEGLSNSMSNDNETVSVDVLEATQPVHKSECTGKQVVSMELMTMW